MKAVALAAALGVVAGCGTPDAFENRERLPGCGRYENRNQPPSADERAKNRCIVRALRSGRQAELVMVRHTVEGDPIPTYVRVLRGRRIELFVDNTRDAFGEREWERQRCTNLRVARGYLDLVGCHEVPLLN